MAASISVAKVEVKDIRFPTSLEQHGSDAMHTDPDYSCAYVIITTNAGDGICGHGLTFTIGRGTEIVVAAVKALAQFVVGKKLSDIFDNFAHFYRQLTSEPQLRWIGPEKGVIHLATAAILNALWDLWAKREGKPLWKLLADMQPEQLVNCIDFRYITDALTKKEALEILWSTQATKSEREKDLLQDGYPAYTTSTAWLGYTDEVLLKRCRHALSEGWTKFKMKVGANLEDDIHRAELLRKEIGYDKTLMMDANQRWGVEETIEWMSHLARFKPLWIEEPTSPDDVLGHATIAKSPVPPFYIPPHPIPVLTKDYRAPKAQDGELELYLLLEHEIRVGAISAMKPFGIGVATGEHCQNRVMFKQFLQASALQFCQIDSCRVGSVNELLSIILMAKKFGVPVCPHAGGVSLCELVQHISMFDYLCVSATKENRVIEYVDHLHEHAKYPVIMKNTCYMPPEEPGYNTELRAETLKDYEYPQGQVWQDLIREGKISH